MSLLQKRVAPEISHTCVECDRTFGGKCLPCRKCGNPVYSPCLHCPPAEVVRYTHPAD